MEKKKQSYEKPVIEIINFEASEIETSASTNDLNIGDWWSND